MRRLAAIAGLLGLLAFLGPARAEGPVDPGVAAGTLAQETLPELGARLARASAATAAGEAWFAGRASLGEAWPRWVGAPSASRAWLAARRLSLDERARLRAAERVAPLDPALGAADARRLGAALLAATEAEERADNLELRLIAAMEAALDRAPLLDEALRAPTRDALLAASQEATAALAVAREAQDAAAEARAAARLEAAGEARARLGRLEAALPEVAALPGSPALAALAGEDLATLRAVLDQGGSVPETLSADLAGDDLRAAAAVDRLRRARPLLADDPGQAVDALLEALDQRRVAQRIQDLERRVAEAELRLSGSENAQPTEAVEALEATYQARTADTRRARAALEGLAPAPEEGGAAPRRQLAQLALKLAETEEKIAEKRLDQARLLAAAGLEAGGAEAAAGAAVEARQKAQEARQKAEEAARDERDLSAKLRAQVADLRDGTARLLEDEAARREGVLQALQDLGHRLEERQAAAAAARALPPLDPQRKPSLDEAYLKLHDLVSDMRAETRRREAWLGQVRADNRVRRDALPSFEGADGSGLSALREDAQAARAEQLAALDSRQGTAVEELDAALSILGAAKGARRAMRPLASQSAWDDVRRDYMPELGDELREIPILLRARLRRGGEWFSALPERVTDLTFLGEALRGSFEGVLLLVLWGVGRRNAERWLAAGLAAVESRRRLALGQRLVALAAPAALVLQASLDVLVAGLLFGFAEDRAVEVALLLLLWQSWALVQAACPALRLALATPEEERLGLRVVTAEVRDLAVGTLRAVLILMLARRVLRFLALGLLEADRLAMSIDWAAGLVFWGLALLLLRRWEGPLRDALAADEDGNRITAALQAPSSSALVGLLQSAGRLVYLTGRWVVRAGGGFAQRRAGMEWLGTVLARRQIKVDVVEVRPPLDPALRAGLAATRPPPGAQAAERRALEAVAARWRADRRQGLVAVVGGRGTGKSTLLDGAGSLLEGEVPVVRLAAPEGLRGEEAGLGWLGAATGSTPAGSVDTTAALVRHLAALPSRIFTVDDAQRLFQRRVGGYGALRAVLSVMLATCDRHLWVVSFHGPCWAYLEGVSAYVGLDRFRAVVRLSPLSPEDLAAWLGGHAESLGLKMSFQGLSSTGPLGGNPALALQRTTAAWWRLLADGSGGNPEIARALWLDSLSPGPSADLVSVGMIAEIDAEPLEKLSVNDLFTLTALIMHDTLGLLDLAEVLNQGPDRVRVAAEHLQGLGVIAQAPDSETYAVTTVWRPAVVRLLKLKHFLHLH